MTLSTSLRRRIYLWATITLFVANQTTIKPEMLATPGRGLMPTYSNRRRSAVYGIRSVTTFGGDDILLKYWSWTYESFTEMVSLRWMSIYGPIRLPRFNHPLLLRAWLIRFIRSAQRWTVTLEVWVILPIVLMLNGAINRADNGYDRSHRRCGVQRRRGDLGETLKFMALI